MPLIIGNMKGEAKGSNPYKIVAAVLAVSLLVVLGGLLHYQGKCKGLEDGVIEAKLAQEKLLSEKLAIEKTAHLQQKELEGFESFKIEVEKQLEEKAAQLLELEKRVANLKRDNRKLVQSSKVETSKNTSELKKVGIEEQVVSKSKR